jgi:predicted NUDIX family NTP pyrophosphohydrolase
MEEFAGAVVYKSPKDPAVMLVHEVGRRKGSWTFPMVQVDSDEDPVQAIRKELREGFGIVPEDLSYLGDITFGAGKKRLHCSVGHVANSAKPIDHRLDIDDAKFFALAEARSLLTKKEQLLLDSLQSLLSMTRSA